MKKFFNYIIILTLAVITIQCKKGEDDPFISFRSRKARVAGEWHLSEGNSVSTNASGGSSSSTSYNYTENAYTRIYSSGAVNTTTSGVYSLKVTFKRDGSFEMTEILNTQTTIRKGNWNFTGKIGKEYKNKEQIVLTYTDYSYSSTGSSSSSSYTGKDIDDAYTIKELRNKKMVLIQDRTSTGTGSSSTYKEEIVLEQ